MNVRTILALLLIVGTSWPADAQLSSTKAPTLPEGVEPYGPVVLVAKEDSVPVRTDPGFVYREIRFLPKGQEVVIDGRQGDWLHVRPQGWILASHLVTREELALATPPAAPASYLEPVRDGIRVRALPNTSSEILRTLRAGERVESAGQDDGWWRLADGGYVAVALLRPVPRGTPAPADDDDDDDDAPGPWVVAGDGVNVRAQPNTASGVARKLSRGDVVEVSAVRDGWAEVPGGWVRADLLQAPAPREPSFRPPPPPPVRRTSRPGQAPRRWSLVDLHGIIFEVTDISRSPILPQLKKEMRATGVLEEDWTYLGLTIGVPEDAPYRFNYAPDRNTVLVEDIDGQKFGNVYARGPVDLLPAHIRQFLTPAVVRQGEKFDGVLLFKPSLKIDHIEEMTIFIGGRMQKLYEDDAPAR